MPTRPPRWGFVSAVGYDWELIEHDDGWAVRQNRRVWIDQLDLDEAVDYVERRRKPDEKVFTETTQREREDITRRLRKARVRR